MAIKGAANALPQHPVANEEQRVVYGSGTLPHVRTKRDASTSGRVRIKLG